MASTFQTIRLEGVILTTNTFQVALNPGMIFSVKILAHWPMGKYAIVPSKFGCVAQD
jgi:hypothetical protein